MDPSPNATVYRGPLEIPQAKKVNDVWSTQINIIGSIGSNGSGVINTVFDPVNQIQTSSDWASLAAVWNEYRVLSAKLQMTPWNKYNLPTTTTVTPINSVLDRNDNATLGSLSAAANYNSCEQHDPSTQFTRSIRMDSVDEAEWINTGTSPGAAARFYIKLYSSGNTPSIVFYDYIAKYVVQFRGRK